MSQQPSGVIIKIRYVVSNRRTKRNGLSIYNHHHPLCACCHPVSAGEFQALRMGFLFQLLPLDKFPHTFVAIRAPEHKIGGPYSLQVVRPYACP